MRLKMKKHFKELIFDLYDQILYKELVSKLESIFEINLSCVDDEGRYFSYGETKDFDVEVIDKIDRSSELLCDDHYVLVVGIFSEKYFNNEFEKYIKDILYSSGVKWKNGVWHPLIKV